MLKFYGEENTSLFLFETIEILGKQNTLKRISDYLNLI